MQPPPEADTVLVRHGELGTKSNRVQARMEERLRCNLAAMLSRSEVDAEVERERGRLYVQVSPASIVPATRAARWTCGVSSASPCLTVPPEIEAIEVALAEIAPVVYRDGTFAVRARRAGSKGRHPFTSAHIEERGGSAIWEAVDGDFDPSVDLDDPDITFHVECRETEAYLFTEKQRGPGGFPLGTQGTAVAMISGGIDSPVAAWEMMRRGVSIVPVYFDFEAYGGPDHVARALESARTLGALAAGHEQPCYRVPVGDVGEWLVENTGSMRMLLLRRFMFRVAESIADEVGAQALVSGESLGQKSSQTGHNLAATSAVTTRPIYRPLVNIDKHHIVERAKSIGTFRTARIPAGCNRIAPDQPATRTNPADTAAVESEWLLEAVADAVDRAERIDLDPGVDDLPFDVTREADSVAPPVSRA